MSELAKMFDHTFLKAYATDENFIKFCREAGEMGAAIVAINSFPIKFCKEQLKERETHVRTAILFL
jgi:deoxyribose-phosphate aldolase